MSHTHPHDLTWDEADPGRHRSDRAGVGQVLSRSGPAHAVPSRTVPDGYADPSLTQARRSFGQAGAAWAELGRPRPGARRRHRRTSGRAFGRRGPDSGGPGASGAGGI